MGTVHKANHNQIRDVFFAENIKSGGTATPVAGRKSSRQGRKVKREGRKICGEGRNIAARILERVCGRLQSLLAKEKDDVKLRVIEAGSKAIFPRRRKSVFLMT